VADNITKQLMSGGKITRGYLGATIQPVTPEIAESVGIPGKKGALVAELVPGGPAEKSGVMAGDVVTAVNGKPVNNASELTRAVASSRSGDTLNLSVVRGGKAITVVVKSGVRPSEADLAKQPWFAATGTVAGEARWVASFAQTPRVEFQLAAHAVAGTNWAAAALEAAGDFSWPRVTVSHATLAGTAGEKLTGHGGWDFRAKDVVDAAVEGQFRRATLARWLPAEVDFEALSVKAEATGPVTQLKHSGSVRAESLHVAGVKPLPEFAWSKTRADAFEACEQAFVLRYLT
jgi:membrane-associated protease RseP (regulator of RpoE activity)